MSLLVRVLLVVLLVAVLLVGVIVVFELPVSKSTRQINITPTPTASLAAYVATMAQSSSSGSTPDTRWDLEIAGDVVHHSPVE